MRACVDFWITKMREKQTDATSPNWTRREDDKCKGLGKGLSETYLHAEEQCKYEGHTCLQEISPCAHFPIELQVMRRLG